MDRISKGRRSENMRRIKAKDTKPEKFLRLSLWHAGIRYVKNCRDLPGRPDIYVKKYKSAIFMNGCFWHQHKGCADARIPKTNETFWKEKFTKNYYRDEEIKKNLISAGIQVIIVWECTVNSMMRNSECKEKIISEIVSAMTTGPDLFYEF